MAIKTSKSKVKTIRPTAAQARALRRKTSFGVVFTRNKEITETRDGKKVRFPGKLKVTSLRRFGSASEATTHGKRFKRLEGHASFTVVPVKKAPNAWVNLKTRKTNPIIGRKRTNRR